MTASPSTPPGATESNTRSPLAWLLVALIRLYRLIPKTRDHCRYHPTCSAYGLEAVTTHGALRGGWLTVKRLGRCQPWGGTGLDPVPPKQPEIARDEHDHHNQPSRGAPVKTAQADPVRS